MKINDIKQSLSITQVLNHYNLNPDRQNRLNCPFHTDKTPSMQIYPETNTAYCFSSNCKTHGKSLDVIDFIKYKEFGHLPEKEAKHQAILKARELIGGSSINNTTTQRKTNKITAVQMEENTEILNKIFTYFKSSYQRKVDNKAKLYLQTRNIDTEKLAELAVEIGYNSAQFHQRGKLTEGEVKQCEQTGLLLKKNSSSEIKYTPWASYCVIFPLKNKDGNITGMYGRSTYANTPNKHFYLKNSKGLFYYPKEETKKLIITESIIDFLSLYQIDKIRSSYELMAMYGTNRLTEEHQEAIKGLKQLEEIIFFLDGDEAGKQSVEKYSELLQKELKSIIISNVVTPEGEDVNSLLQGHEKEILIHLINQRKPVSFISTEDKQNMNKQLQTSYNTTSQIISKKQAQISLEKSEDTGEARFYTDNSELLYYITKELKITILGGIRISGLDRLKVTLKIEKNTEEKPSGLEVIRHSLDLYHAKQTEQLIELINANLELGSYKAKQIIANLTTELENYREKRLEALKPKTKEAYRMSDKEIKQAIRYLKHPNLMENTKKDIESCGIIGEHINAMTGYIVNLSRKREKPLHVMYLGASGSGKTHLQEGLAQLVPEEDRIEATGLSDQSLYYEGLKLKGKILFIEDLDGAENVMYIIREFQSKGKISKRVAWRDSKGNTKTIEVVAQGPVVISSCTTKERLYEDNANRCILLYIDQSKEQDKKIMDYMKAKSTGIIHQTNQDEILLKMQNVQRVLRPIKVYNPYAHLIELPPEIFKPRRSLPLLLGFIESITFYYQYQREVITTDDKGNQVEPFIQSTYEDIEIGLNLMKNVLFSKSDELSKSARDFLERLKREVKQGEAFYLKDIRQKLRLNASNIKRYMIELKAYGYIKAKTGNRYRGLEYVVVNYDEYEMLRQGIEKRIEAILQNIRKISGSVVRSGSFSKTNH